MESQIDVAVCLGAAGAPSPRDFGWSMGWRRWGARDMGASMAQQAQLLQPCHKLTMSRQLLITLHLGCRSTLMPLGFFGPVTFRTKRGTVTFFAGFITVPLTCASIWSLLGAGRREQPSEGSSPPAEVDLRALAKQLFPNLWPGQFQGCSFEARPVERAGLGTAEAGVAAEVVRTWPVSCVGRRGCCSRRAGDQ